MSPALVTAGFTLCYPHEIAIAIPHHKLSTYGVTEPQTSSVVDGISS